jgi:dihydroorotase-like cyclic amidohydrolase
MVDPEKFHLKSSNTPFAGMEFTGRTEMVIVGGKVKSRR